MRSLSLAFLLGAALPPARPGLLQAGRSIWPFEVSRMRGGANLERASKQEPVEGFKDQCGPAKPADGFVHWKSHSWQFVVFFASSARPALAARLEANVAAQMLNNVCSRNSFKLPAPSRPGQDEAASARKCKRAGRRNHTAHQFMEAEAAQAGRRQQRVRTAPRSGAPNRWRKSHSIAIVFSRRCEIGAGNTLAAAAAAATAAGSLVVEDKKARKWQQIVG